ncbi:MAG: hypothetical protein ABR577_02705 [Pyrinomonadaceae bacterium]
MFCSSCGAADQSANAYCKRCGEWLPEIHSLRGKAWQNTSPEQSLKAILFASGLSVWFGFFSSLALFLIFFSKNISWNNILLAAVFCLSIAIYQTGVFINALKLRQRIKKGRTDNLQIADQDASQLSAEANANGLLNAKSVTENTTELLEPVPHPRERLKQR